MQECGVVQWQVHEPFLSTFRSAVTVETMRRAVREYICNTTYPMPSGPLDIAPSTPPSQSTSTNNACGRHDCILPKLTLEVSTSTIGNRHRCSLSGQSSPGILHDGQQPSYGTRQIPQTSPSPSGSSGSVEPVSQRHCAIACQFFIVTFIWYACIAEAQKVGWTGW